MTDLRTKLAQGWEMAHSHRESTATAYALLIIAECLVEQREHDSGEMRASIEAEMAAEQMAALLDLEEVGEQWEHSDEAYDLYLRTLQDDEDATHDAASSRGQ